MTEEQQPEKRQNNILFFASQWQITQEKSFSCSSFSQRRATRQVPLILTPPPILLSLSCRSGTNQLQPRRNRSRIHNRATATFCLCQPDRYLRIPVAQPPAFSSFRKVHTANGKAENQNKSKKAHMANQSTTKSHPSPRSIQPTNTLQQNRCTSEKTCKVICFNFSLSLEAKPISKGYVTVTLSGLWT